MAATVAKAAAPVKAPIWPRVFLKSIGAPVNQNTVSFLVSWWHKEGGALTNNANFNWLNTTHGQRFPSINSVGVKSYPNFATGIQMLKQVFTLYPNLTNSLKSGHVDLNNPGVQSDLNKWLSGKATPGLSPYVSSIAQGMGEQPPFRPSDSKIPGSVVAGAPEGLQSVTSPSPYVAPNLGTVGGFPAVGKPLAQMPGVPKIGQVQIFQGPTKNGTPAPPLTVQHDPGVKPNARTNEVIDFAREYLGTKYTFGGTTPSGGFDCSGFVQFVYAHMGVALPRTTFEQAKVGTPVSINNLKPGDILFFNTENDPRGPSHEGMYIGNGQFIQAPHTGDVVKISRLSGYYKQTFVEARRVRG